jgi:hypothetical protein
MPLAIRRFRSGLHHFLRIDTGGDMNGNIFSNSGRRTLRRAIAISDGPSLGLGKLSLTQTVWATYRASCHKFGDGTDSVTEAIVAKLSPRGESSFAIAEQRSALLKFCHGFDTIRILNIFFKTRELQFKFDQK